MANPAWPAPMMRVLVRTGPRFSNPDAVGQLTSTVMFVGFAMMS